MPTFTKAEIEADIQEFKNNVRMNFEEQLIKENYSKEYADRMRAAFEEKDFKKIYKKLKLKPLKKTQL